MQWGVCLVFESNLAGESLSIDLIEALGSAQETLDALCDDLGVALLVAFSSVTRESWEAATGEPAPAGLPIEAQWYDASRGLGVVRALRAEVARRTEAARGTPADDLDDDPPLFPAHVDGARVAVALQKLEEQLVCAASRQVRFQYEGFEL